MVLFGVIIRAEIGFLIGIVTVAEGHRVATRCWEGGLVKDSSARSVKFTFRQ